MTMNTRPLATFWFALCCALTALAQTPDKQVSPPQSTKPSALTITAAATERGVRFVALGQTDKLRLEVFDATGELRFDTGFRAGSLIDWQPVDKQEQALADGNYICVVTAHDLSGALRVKQGGVTVQAGRAVLELPDAGVFASAEKQLPAGQALTTAPELTSSALTVATHTGQEGRVVATRGALSFRSGNLFAGLDKEMMRLNEDGSVTVKGTLTASKGIAFADGTVQTTGLSGRKDAQGNVVPAATGTGTQDRLAKWTDNAGMLGDSLLGEVGNGIELRPPVAGVGVNPTLVNVNNVAGFAQLQAYPAAGAGANMSFSVAPRGTGVTNNRAQVAVFNTDFMADTTNYEFAGLRARGSDFVLGTGKSRTGVVRPLILSAGLLSDNPTNDGQLVLATNGNVGVGVTSPLTKLDVAGTINTWTQYNIDGNRVMSLTAAGGSPGTIGNNIFVGVGAGQVNAASNNSFFGSGAGATNTTGDLNAFFGSGAGRNNTTGRGNAFFGSDAGAANTTGGGSVYVGAAAGFQNTTGGANVFIGEAAGAVNTTGGDNVFIGTMSGDDNKTGRGNVFIGIFADSLDQNSQSNTLIGGFSRSAAGVTNATAIGTDSLVTQSNSLVLGSVIGVRGTTANPNVGLGTTAPKAQLHVQGGNIYVGAPGQGLILKSPDGSTCRLLTIDNAGALSTTAIACP